MTLAYFDCFSGASGDMIVAALLDAGLDFEALKAELGKLDLAGYTLSVEKVRRGGLAGTRFAVATERSGQPHRRLADILAIIDAAALPERSTEMAKAIFTRLGQAEARVHGVDLQQVHFHEVGAVDSIVDVVAAAAGIELLGIERVVCSPIPVGSGAVATAHGLLPVPAPATAELLRGAATAGVAGDVGAGELPTPTGAAVLTTLAEGFGPVPAMELRSVGYGAGSRDSEGMPNLLRVFIGAESGAGAADTVVELSANLDDCTGELLGATMEKLLASGCLDAWCMPIYMKKSRPAWMLSALCAPADAQRFERLLFAETTTLGVRRRTCSRSKLSRRQVTVETPFGPLRVKVGAAGQKELTASPEFSDCLAAAQAHGVPVKEGLAAAVEAYRRRADQGQGSEFRP